MPPPLVAITRQVPGTPALPGAAITMAPAEPQLTRPQLLAFIQGATAIITMFHDKVDDEFLAAAGPQLKAVCNFAVGIDNIDLAACRRRGVVVTNTPDAVTEGTANLAWALLLACTRRLIPADRFVRAGRFEKEGNTFPTGWLGLHLAGQTMHIVGAGRIGAAVARRAVAFGMHITYTARSPHPDWESPFIPGELGTGGSGVPPASHFSRSQREKMSESSRTDEGAVSSSSHPTSPIPLSARRLSLTDGLASADVVSLHTPLTPETRHLINAANLALLKPTAVLINTARGPIVDEAALAAALKAKKIWAAGLDVYEHEPKVHPDLLPLDNVVFAPHIGSGEKYWREQMTAIACRNAAAVLAGQVPPNPVT